MSANRQNFPSQIYLETGQTQRPTGKEHEVGLSLNEVALLCLQEVINNSREWSYDGLH